MWWTDGRTDKAVCRVIINVLLSHVAVADVGWLALLLPLLFCHGLIWSMTSNKLNIFLSFLDELCRILQNQGNKIRGFGNGEGKMKNTKDSTLLAVLKYSILVLFKLIYYYIVGIAVMRPCAKEIRRARGGGRNQRLCNYIHRVLGQESRVVEKEDWKNKAGYTAIQPRTVGQEQ